MSTGTPKRQFVIGFVAGALIQLTCILIYVYAYTPHAPVSRCQELQPPASTSASLENAIQVSETCLKELRKVISHQRGGWGEYSPADLYVGAKEAFDLGLKRFLPSKIPLKVMDIGCGMGLYNYFLFKHYSFDSNLHVFLFDKTTDEIKDKSFVDGGWHPDGRFSFYTNLHCASDILKNNTNLHNNVHPIEASLSNLDALEDSSFDLVYSLLSYGHHYPVSTYLGHVHRILKSGGYLILDLRKSSKSAHPEGLKELIDAGFECEIVRHRQRGKTVKCIKE